MIKAFLISSLFTLIWPALNIKKRVILLLLVAHAVANILLAFYAYRDHSEAIVTFSIFSKYIISFKENKLGWTLLSIIIPLWLPSYLYSASYLFKSKEGRDTRFLFFLNLSLILCIFLSLSANAITMYILYELITFSTIPLVSHNNNPVTRAAVIKYINYLVYLSTLLFLPSIIYLSMYYDCGQFEAGGNKLMNNDEPYLKYLIIGTIFGIAKSAIFPFFGWLPAAMAANYPTSGALHAVVVVNSGIYCITKFIYEFYGTYVFQVFLDQNQYILILPSIGVVYAGINGIFENNIKKILAWSTISYLNLIIVILFSNLGATYAMTGLLIHSYVKITLFFLFGYLYLQKGATKIQDLSGVASHFPLFYCIVILSALILSSPPVPILGAFKTIVKDQAYYMGFPIMLLTVVISTFFNFIYLGRIILFMSSKSNAEKVRINYFDTCVVMFCGTFIMSICIICNIKSIYTTLFI